MRNIKIIWLVEISLVILLLYCNQNTFYQPEDLSELTEAELFDAENGIKEYSQNNVVYKNKFGHILSFDSLRKVKYGCFNNIFFAKYINEKNEIVEIVLRPATQNELETKAKISLAWEKQPVIKLEEVDCKEIGQILDTIYELDQGMRQNGNLIDTAIEHKCLNKAISIIENCGIPTLNEVNEHQMTALWLVFQHTHHNIRKQYFPLFLKSAENGDLKMSQIALMIDRMLMQEGKPQKYGSQVQAGCQTDWELYNLENPETVNKRRFEMGMIPLKEYLHNYGIKFEVEQSE